MYFEFGGKFGDFLTHVILFLCNFTQYPTLLNVVSKVCNGPITVYNKLKLCEADLSKYRNEYTWTRYIERVISFIIWCSSPFSHNLWLSWLFLVFFFSGVCQKMEQNISGNAKKEKLEVLAPFASLEDLSPEQESPIEERYQPNLPQITEEQLKKATAMSSTVTETATATVTASTSSTNISNNNNNSDSSNNNHNNNNNNNNNNSLAISSTPRIDISRASSSSHQDDSSPERELFGTGEFHFWTNCLLFVLQGINKTPLFTN